MNFLKAVEKFNDIQDHICFLEYEFGEEEREASAIIRAVVKQLVKNKGELATLEIKECKNAPDVLKLR